MDPRLLALCEAYGVFLRKEALALGYRDEVIARLVKDRVWHRVRRGAYVMGDAWRRADADERYRMFVMAAWRQSKTDVVPSHTSAVALHGGPLWGQALDLAHLTRKDARTGRKEAGVQQHRGLFEPGDLVPFGTREVIAPTRAALEVCSIAGVEPSLCVVNDFLHRGLTTPEGLAERYGSSMGWWPGSLHTDLVLRLADRRIESVGETRTFFACWREGVPAPEPQVEVYDENGIMIGRVDFAWPDLGVFLEFDGLRKYLRDRRAHESIEDVVLREKHREELICSITGWRCIRITWADLQRSGVLGLRIRRALFLQAG
jgi:hypothetical protein